MLVGALTSDRSPRIGQEMLYLSEIQKFSDGHYLVSDRYENGGPPEGCISARVDGTAEIATLDAESSIEPAGPGETSQATANVLDIDMPPNSKTDISKDNATCTEKPTPLMPPGLPSKVNMLQAVVQDNDLDC